LETMLPENSEPALESLLGIAHRSAERIQRLTNSLLDINRLEAGQPLGNLHLTSPRLLIEDAVDASLPAAKNKGLDIAIATTEETPPVLVDADMIRRVIINLLENAVKFTPSHGKIEIGALQEEKFVRIWVSDNGPGISTPDQERIFEKFTRLNTQEGPRGAGLGLAFCQLAVAGHGGRIWVESGQGTGASFNFTLPVEIMPVTS